MKLLDRFLNAPEAAPAQKPGRHSTVGLVDRLSRELAELKASREMEVAGYQDALQRAAHEVRENAKYRAWFQKADAGWRAADAEVQRLKRLLEQDAGVPGTEPQPAVADMEGSCFNEPAPEPVTEGPRAIPDTPAAPVECEAADVNAETQPVPQLKPDQTQAVDVTTLREAMGMGRTAVIPVAAAPPTQIAAGPGSTDPTELSQATGKRAVINVATAMEEAS